MHKTVEDINPTKKKFVVEIPADVLENKIEEALRNLGRTMKIPGFRPGKAPLSLLERRFGKDVEMEVLERIIPEYYVKAIKEEALFPVAAPVFEEYDFKRKMPLRMTFTVEFLPEIGDLKYEGYTVKDETVEVTDEEVENTTRRLQAEKSTYEKVEDTISEGDLVVVDYEIVEEDQKVTGQFIKVGTDIIPREISEALTGRKAGEPFEVTASFPEDYVNKNFSGKTLTLKGTINEVKRLKQAELDDGFAKDLGYEDLEKLKEAVRESIQKVKLEMLEKRQKAELIEQLVEGHEFAIPESLLESELRMLVEEEMKRKPDADAGQLREEMKDQAVRNVKANILLDVIAEKENVEVTENELKAKITELASSMYLSPENFVDMYLKSDGAMAMFRQNIVRDKALDLVLQKAVKEPDGSEKADDAAVKS
ncbi:MAG: trigger factor [Nitrospirae bacterium]|nr:trigger factor [Nitrospirota bacterium]